MESIDHFSHQHPLDPCKLTGEEKNKCSACERLCVEQSYGCEKCGFFLDKECAELPRELHEHPLHPPHPLKLSDTANYLGQIHCDFCYRRSRGFTFRCEKCDFDLDIVCALTAKCEAKKSISNFSHEHLLTLEEDDIVQEVWCNACEKRCLNAAYVCKECAYFLHKSCAELPAELDHHPLHTSHTLKLQTTAYDGRVWCDYCGNKVLGFIYHCEQCGYDLDVKCARMHIFVAQEQIKHFGDMHPLVLSEKKEEDDVLCSACQGNCAGDTFGCEICEFFLHRSCAELPEDMNNPFHKEHPLKLQAAFSNVCVSCNSGIHGYTYRCDQCDFDLDVKCASKPYEEIQHFAHTQHKLKRTLKIKDEKCSCGACEKRCSGLVYGCDRCKFFLHESCALLPHLLQHYFHEHHLTLQPQVEAKDQITCRACEKRCGGFTYSCLDCSFHMDIDCTLMAERERSEDNIKHFCHGHPLKLLSEKDALELCSACKERKPGTMYGCNRCQMWLHKSCADDLHEQIDHYFHRDKGRRLVLKTQVRNKKCKACRMECKAFAFNCEGCDFNLDVVCALMPQTMPQGHKFLGHGHPLNLIEMDPETGIHCSVCEKFYNGPTYECRLCDFHVHKTCGELQENTISDIHPKHTLELKTKDRFKCAACLKESSGFTYECTVCSQISLHVGCKDVKPLIKYEGHQHHPLAFFESVYEKEILPCCGCGSEIPSSIEKQRDNVVRCVDCNHNLHLICGPLPIVINSKKHKHPLVLRNTFVVEGSDESYCDACEKERDPNEGVYKCERCPYVAAFDCMQAEVIELLQGKENHVELRSLRGGFTGEVITEGIEATEMVQKKRAEGDGQATGIEEVCIVWSLDDLLDSFIGDEDIKLTGSVEFLEKEMTDLQGGISRIVPDVSSYPYKALKELMARLETSVREAEFSMIFFEKEEIEEVEEFMTIKSLVPTLKQLLQRHKDIIKRSDQRSESKSLVITMLWGAIQSMVQFEGQINNISETLLFNWWNHFMLAKCAGFDIQFLMDRLKGITLAFFALKAKEVQEQKLQELAGKIGESEKFFSDMEEKLGEISKEEERVLANSSGSGSFEEPRVEPELLEKKLHGVVANEMQ